MTTPRPFAQVDVFTATPYLGNPLAVVLDGSGLSTEDMHRFTAWTNLSECTFVLPPTPDERAAGADYRVRIFCPGRELPFAGHPTLGTCHAWLAHGGQPQHPDRVVQACGAGLVSIRRTGSHGGTPRLAFAAPPLRREGPLDEADVAHIARGLGVARTDIVAHAWCDNGPGWRAVMLNHAEQVQALQPDPAVLNGWEVGVVGRHAIPADAAGDTPLLEVRAFFPGNQGLMEDPVTGSLNAALAQWLIPAGLAPAHYVAAQGHCLHRAGRVHIDRDADGTVWVGGASVTCITGTAQL